MTWNLRCEKEKIYIYRQSIIEIHIRWIKIWGRMEIKNRLLESSSFNRPSDNFLYLMDDFENITRIVSIYQLWTLKSRVKFKLNFSQVDDNVMEMKIRQKLKRRESKLWWASELEKWFIRRKGDFGSTFFVVIEYRYS